METSGLLDRGLGAATPGGTPYVQGNGQLRSVTASSAGSAISGAATSGSGPSSFGEALRAEMTPASCAGCVPSAPARPGAAPLGTLDARGRSVAADQLQPGSTSNLAARSNPAASAVEAGRTRSADAQKITGEGPGLAAQAVDELLQVPAGLPGTSSSRSASSQPAGSPRSAGGAAAHRPSGVVPARGREEKAIKRRAAAEQETSLEGTASQSGANGLGASPAAPAPGASAASATAAAGGLGPEPEATGRLGAVSRSGAKGQTPGVLKGSGARRGAQAARANELDPDKLAGSGAARDESSSDAATAASLGTSGAGAARQDHGARSTPEGGSTGLRIGGGEVPAGVGVSVPGAPEAPRSVTALDRLASHVPQANAGPGDLQLDGIGGPAGGTHTMQAAPGSLEIGLAVPEHGWLRVRAELGPDGAVSASVTTGSPHAAETLDREIPAIHGYLTAEHINLGSLTVHAGERAAGHGAQAEGAGYGTGPSSFSGESRGSRPGGEDREPGSEARGAGAGPAGGNAHDEPQGGRNWMSADPIRGELSGARELSRPETGWVPGGEISQAAEGSGSGGGWLSVRV